MTTSVKEAFANQVDYCRANGAPLTATICKAVFDRLDPQSALGKRVFGWTGDPLKDVVPLRVAGGIHALHLANDEPQLAPVYAAQLTRAEVEEAIGAVIAERQEAILPWLDGPPQTNEAGRSAGLMAGLKWLAGEGYGPKFELIEIGSSGGINLMIDRFRIELGGAAQGPADSPVRLAPKWTGNAPPDVPVEIVSTTGCDRAPIGIGTREGQVKLAAYVWPEMTERMARLEAVFAFAEDDPPQVVQADAADFVEARLAAPQEEGVTRVLMHSLVWQYLPPETQARIRLAMKEAGAKATPQRPLAWVELEGDRTILKHRLHVTAWPGKAERVELARAHAHGGWMEWLA
ncbi:DUF2332 domain-containing protein [Sphingomicrobium sediminis]|uniref:DUF2332 domain-containing protein n=1 Tax=Sphingomicrobium sediminis TaxID=2950949 RepID=A0A9X2ELU6_9SPHN|nr:DUF2332 domain-containing protein [Sphingomicrobium sediminis]MCM8557854.1 DUF2332 domain-containing protein [Sphingomicrobium sediminis]